MPIISITTWPNVDDAKSQELIEEITLTTRKVTGAPLDKIVVYINEIPKNRWGEGGTMGDDPEFATKSRRSS